jgi:carbon monoxide dehydrogenase subunit G
MRNWLFVLLLANASLCAAVPDDQDIDVKVAKSGDLVEVDVSLRVNVDRSQAWKVLTDYDDMVRFVSTLDSSRIIRKAGNELDVAQKGKVRFGLLSFPFATVRRIELEPYHEIRSFLIEGDMANSRFTTTLVDEGDTTLILQHGQMIPGLWVPPWIGSAIIVARTRQQWQEIRAEILRRRLPSTAAAP